MQQLLIDSLINEQIRTVKHIETKEKKVLTTYLDFDDTSTGRTRINSNVIIPKSNRWVPIEKEEVSMYLRKYKTMSPPI